MADDTAETFRQGAETQILLDRANDYRRLHRKLTNSDYDYTARAGHDVFDLNGSTTPFEIIIHETFSGDLSTFIAEHTEGLARARPH